MFNEETWLIDNGAFHSDALRVVETFHRVGDTLEYQATAYDPKVLADKGDGSSAWVLYGMKRALWRTKTFAEKFPNEKDYRHTLAEEADALKTMANQAKSLLKEQKVKQLDSSIENVVKLNSAGLLEAYILFAKPDQGIARDYVTYRILNRDKLRRYWKEFVVSH